MNTFDNTIPAANNYPGNDQPKMLANNVSTSNWAAIDHVGYGQTNNGQHVQVTYPGNATVVAPTAPSINSILYTAPGTALNTTSDLRFVNSNATFPINFIRAAGICTIAGLVAGQSFNVTSVVRSAVGIYNVTLPANLVTGTNYGVIISSTPATGFSPSEAYIISSSTAFTIAIYQSQSGSTRDPSGSFSFMVFQI